jgi:hypothetical protein
MSRGPPYYPGVAFIILVLRTSTGDPTQQAVNPAMQAQARWHGIPSLRIPLEMTIYLY